MFTIKPVTIATTKIAITNDNTKFLLNNLIRRGGIYHLTFLFCSVQKITIFCTLLFYVYISKYYIELCVQKPNKKSMFTKDLVIKLWYSKGVYRRSVF